MKQYEQIIRSIQPTPRELEIINKVKQGIASDEQKSPWNSNKWYIPFTKANQDGLTLKEAPKNKLLMIVTDSLGTFYVRGRGQSLMRGSILIKLEDNLIYALDAYSWSALSSGQAHVYNNNGFFEIDLNSRLYGRVKTIPNVKV